MSAETTAVAGATVSAATTAAPSLAGNTPGALKTAVAVGAKTPLLVVSSVKALALAHPLGLLGLLAAGIVSVGAYDSIKGYLRGKKQDTSMVSVLNESPKTS